MSFQYSDEFERRIRDMHRGMEDRPQYPAYLAAQLGGATSRVVTYANELVPEIEYHCGPLVRRRVLDCGCGTGATTVALALAGARVTAFDVDEESLEICRLRVAEHGLQDRVEGFHRAASLGGVSIDPPEFDVVLLNGVIEHIPASVEGLRKRVLADVAARVRPGGYLVVSDTPNRLIPHDGHTTGLWWIPWTRPGSSRAYRRAVARGRYREAPTVSPGPRGLEEEGAWGITYWGLRSLLEGDLEVVNLEPGHDRHIHHRLPPSPRRRLLERLLHPLAVRLLGVPLVAFSPYLDNLVLRKAPTPRGSGMRNSAG